MTNTYLLVIYYSNFGDNLGSFSRFINFLAACNLVQCLLVREGKTHTLRKFFYLP
jgi:hypothetical protein